VKRRELSAIHFFTWDWNQRLARAVVAGSCPHRNNFGECSGDLLIPFSTASPNASNPDQITHDVQTVPNDLMDLLFTGVM
jgi:L-aminopeptidase/D-esterase-like protein